MRGESFESFAAEPDLHDLIYFRLLCVSEAVRHSLLLDPMIAERHPEIPWPAIRALGNVLRHEYGEVDRAIIWQTFARGDVDALVEAVRQEITRLDA
ncbi:MAG: DUF86 domain-containing protein [Candidatus Eremiobacteraeota bacterium]|nr:DUF86 domain-containing protein [Candidatus Eremiobacteraeota bacterium]